MRGQPTHAQPSALLQEEKEGVEVDRLSALERQVERNRENIARLRRVVSKMMRNYETFLNLQRRVLKEDEA